MIQSPSLIILVRPDHFGFNPETAESNAFQKTGTLPDSEIREKAANEFRNFLEVLRKNKIRFQEFPSVKNEYTPDAVFPNNWFSIHHEGKIFLYPMMAENRRKERNPEIINWLTESGTKKNIIDLTQFENENKFLEGTGSIVFHHPARTAYACVSPRTNEEVLLNLCSELNYTPCVFRATGPKGEEIYHTNVVMNIGSGYAVICTEAIDDAIERGIVKKNLEKNGLKIIEISFSQMNSFAGNMFEVVNDEGEKKLLMSETALKSLTEKQIESISEFAGIISSPIPTIEHYGGGSIRCMVAGVF